MEMALGGRHQRMPPQDCVRLWEEQKWELIRWTYQQKFKFKHYTFIKIGLFKTWEQRGGRNFLCVSFGGGYVKPWRGERTMLLLVVLVRNQTKQGG